MGLYDEENNEGICDCLELTGEQAKSELRSIFSDETGVCHQQHTQVNLTKMVVVKITAFISLLRVPVNMDNGSY